ncbi:MAG TPA: type II toxin-antitoxin system RelE/ParE family toxin [Planctomycetota bacterium]|nr:type II toxin-antitoxin system RelE/ParE family toxin [Planctomycetota bacterium]
MYRVDFSEDADRQLQKMRAYDRASVVAQIREVLTVNPTLESKGRVKKLRQPAPTQYRLRVRDYRIFYDVEDKTVHIRAILSKSDTADYYGDA